MDARGDESLRPIEAYRGYLHVLARARLPALVRKHMDTSDLVQITLLDAVRAEPTFRGHSPGEQMAWLRRMLMRNLADAVRDLRRAKRDVARERRLGDLLDRSSARLEWMAAQESSSLDARLDRRDRVLEVADALASLPHDQQEAVILRHLVELPMREIAELMARSESAVTALVHRGLVALRAKLAPGGSP